MAQRSHVPKFGNWESEENVPYTAYFDKARKGRTSGGAINPNDPQDNPDAFPDSGSHPSQSIPEPDQEPIVRGHRPSHQHRRSREDGESYQHVEGHIVGSGEAQKKPVRSDRSFERSPLHPQHQARMTGGRGNKSPFWEGKNSNDSSHGTAGRSRIKAHGREDENHEDKGAAVPKFGEWDETNPSSSDGFTHIFNKVREERQTGQAAVRAPSKGVEPSYNTTRNHNTDDKVKGGCFSWCGK